MGGVLVCAVSGAVITVCKGSEDEVWHVDVEGVLGGVAVGGGGDGGGGCALEGGGWVGVVGVQA